MSSNRSFRVVSHVGLRSTPDARPPKASYGLLHIVAQKDALLTVREVTDDQGTVSASQTFFGFGTGAGVIPPPDPIAIAIRHGEIWVVDGATDVIALYDARSLPP